MSRFLSRRRVLTTGAGAALGLGAAAAPATASPATASPATASPATASPSTPRHASGPEETRTLDELYRAALAEGGKLVLYAGGDTPNQLDAVKAGFTRRFPGMDMTLIVDYSKYHGTRVDNQLATGSLVPDLVQLQTLHDFARWKEQGRLLPYKPAGFSKLHHRFRDPQGAWVAGAVIGFSFMYGPAAVGSDAPRTPLDLVDPKWKGKIASSYPHDDDAVLYLYTLYAERYGWDWVARLAAQDVRFGRGTDFPEDAVSGGQAAIGVGGSGSLAASASQPVRWAVADGHPFVAWGQRLAVLRQARNPTAAKLYINWVLSAERQQAARFGWSVRTDVTPAGGLKPIWEYPNAHLDGFPRFMADRAEVERWKQTFALYFGEVKGDPTTGWLGLHPGA